jgi:LAO/AO transport system kinase
MGDEIQAIKAGLLEVADIVVVNKGDRPGAHRTAADLRAMLTATGRVRSPRDVDAAAAGGPGAGEAGQGSAGGGSGAGAPPVPPPPEVLVTTATTGDGVPELVAAIDRHRARLGDGGGQAAVRRARAAALVWALLGDRVRGRLTVPDAAAETAGVLDAVARHDLDPYAAADRLLAALVATAAGEDEADSPGG